MKTTTRHNARQTIEAREEFKNAGNTMYGQWHYYVPVSTGQLPEQYDRLLVSDFDENGSDRVYVVYSYETPIGWWTETNGWRRPDVRYSATTAKHQGFIPTAPELEVQV